MKILQVHNWYKVDSGENIFVDGLIHLLRSKGEQVTMFKKNSKEINSSFFSKVRAFGNGIYSLFSARVMARLIEEDRPDVVHVHNLYPLISPSILRACKRSGVPVVMTAHNYRLSCPVGPHFHKEDNCMRCSHGREYWCILNNCRESLFESTAYAFRNLVARKLRLFKDNVTLFVAPSEFVKCTLVENGFPDNRVVVVPNMVHMTEFADSRPSLGDYVGYAGRISPEKGILMLLQAAASIPDLPFRIAGDYSKMPDLLKEAPENVQFLGHMSREELAAFYQQTRFIVIPSLWFEPFGLVAIEAMSHGCPVITSGMGGLQEIVQEGITGFLFEPGNSENLARKIRLLWENPSLCQKMGQAARKRAISEYHEDVHYNNLIATYEKAIEINMMNNRLFLSNN